MFVKELLSDPYSLGRDRVEDDGIKGLGEVVVSSIGHTFLVQEPLLFGNPRSLGVDKQKLVLIGLEGQVDGDGRIGKGIRSLGEHSGDVESRLSDGDILIVHLGMQLVSDGMQSLKVAHIDKHLSQNGLGDVDVGTQEDGLVLARSDGIDVGILGSN